MSQLKVKKTVKTSGFIDQCDNTYRCKCRREKTWHFEDAFINRAGSWIASPADCLNKPRLA